MRVIEYSLFDSVPDDSFNAANALFLQFGSFDLWLQTTNCGIDILYKYFYFM